MRVTQGMITNNMLGNLTKSYQQLDKYLDRLNTGRKISRPSDDPFVAIKGMSYRTQVKQMEQFQRNTGEVHSWMDNTDAALDNATSTLQRMRELTTQASNDTYSESERKNILEEVKQLKEDLIDVANTRVNGKYIFNGVDTATAPIVRDENGIEIEFSEEQDFRIEIASGIKIEVNIHGESIFGDDLLGENGAVEKLMQALKDDNQEEISASLGALDGRIDEVINSRAQLGARMNRVDLIENRVTSQGIIAKETMAKNENVDYEEAIMDLITQETLHRAALSAGTRVIQPTLMDFLR